MGENWHSKADLGANECKAKRRQWPAHHFRLRSRTHSRIRLINRTHGLRTNTAVLVNHLLISTT